MNDESHPIKYQLWQVESSRLRKRSSLRLLVVVWYGGSVAVGGGGGWRRTNRKCLEREVAIPSSHLPNHNRIFTLTNNHLRSLATFDSLLFV